MWCEVFACLGLAGFADYTGFQSASGPTSTSVDNQLEEFGNFQTGAQSVSQAPPLLQPTPNGSNTGMGMGMVPLLQPTPAQPVDMSGMGMGLTPPVQPAIGTNPTGTLVSCMTVYNEPVCLCMTVCVHCTYAYSDTLSDTASGDLSTSQGWTMAPCSYILHMAVCTHCPTGPI